MPASADDAWAPGPLRPHLTDGAVHVWRADLRTVASELTELLCEDERERAGRILNERDGEMWARSRGLLRELLGRYLQREPRSLRFVLGEHGKPALETSPATAPVSFNISHSDHLALYAFAAVGAVGVDVEVGRRSIDEVALAARVIGTAEARRLESLDPDTRRREFLRMWARREAQLKCLGVGIGGSVDNATYEPWVFEVEPGPDAAGAVAAERPARELRCWDCEGLTLP